MTTIDEFKSKLREIYSLYSERQNILEEPLDVDNWRSLVEKLEGKYKESCEQFNQEVELHFDIVQGYLNSNDENLVIFSTHLCLFSQIDECINYVATLLSNQDYDNAETIVEALGFLPSENIEQVLDKILSWKVFTVERLGPLIGKRQIEKYFQKITTTLEDSFSALDDFESIEALYYIAIPQQLKTLLFQYVNASNNIGHYNESVALSALFYNKSSDSMKKYRSAIETGYIKTNICNSIGRFGNRTDTKFFLSALENETNEIFIEDLLIGLRLLGNPEVIPQVLPYLSSPNQDIRVAANNLLKLFTTKQTPDAFNSGETELVEYWNNWLEFGGKFIDTSKRYVNGEIFSIDNCLGGLQDTLSAEREYSHLMLIGYTGKQFAFDSEAMLSEQKKWIDIWQKYLDKNKDLFEDGKWYRWGELAL